MQTPLVTIGISCFNAVDTIERAIRSAAAQDWPNTEIVVVDDASTDGSFDKILEIKKDIPLREIRLAKNAGLSGVLNTIIGVAEGEFIAFFDDDDFSYADRISRSVGRIGSYETATSENLILCFGGRNVIPGGHNRPVHVWEGMGHSSPEPRGPAIADYLLGVSSAAYVWGAAPCGTLMARASVFQAVGPFDPSIRRADSWDYSIRLGLLGGHCISVPGPVADQHKTDTPDKGGRTDLNMNLALVEKYKPYLVQRRHYWAAIAAAHARFYGNKRKKSRARAFSLLRAMLAPQVVVAAVLKRLPAGAWTTARAKRFDALRAE